MDFNKYINLSKIDLRGVKDFSIDQLLYFLASHQEISSLSLSETGLNADNIYKLGVGFVKGELSNITHLNLSNNNIGIWGYYCFYKGLSTAYKTLPKTDNEWTINDSRNSFSCYYANSKITDYIKLSLKSLNLSNTSINSDAFNTIIRTIIENELNLTELWLDNSSIEYYDFMELRLAIENKGILKDIEILSFENSGYIYDTDIMLLLRLANEGILPKLTKVNFTFKKVKFGITEGILEQIGFLQLKKQAIELENKIQKINLCPKYNCEVDSVMRDAITGDIIDQDVDDNKSIKSLVDIKDEQMIVNFEDEIIGETII